jgi:RND family efflux transporter MFP subunit
MITFHSSHRQPGIHGSAVLLLITTFLAIGLLVTGCGTDGPAAEAAHTGDTASRTSQAHDDGHEDGAHGGEHHDDHGSAESGAITLPTASLASLRIETVDVTEAPVGATRQFPGRVVPVPDQEGMVTSLLEGRIERVLANEGDRVQAGQSLAVVTGPRLGDLIAELRHAYIDLERQQRLADRDVGIEKNLQAAQTAFAAARQHLRALGLSAEEVDAMATATHDASGIQLRAPTSGVILKRDATQGGPVTPGQVLFHLADLSPMWVEADVYERDLPLLEAGMDVRVGTTSEDGRVRPGTLRQILPNVDQERRVTTVRIQVPNEDEALRPGMYVTAEVATGTDVQPALPTRAIMTDGTQSYVIVAESDSTFRRVPVAAPADGDGQVAVPELPVGTRVVTTGAFQIASAMSGVEAGHAH